MKTSTGGWRRGRTEERDCFQASLSLCQVNNLGDISPFGRLVLLLLGAHKQYISSKVKSFFSVAVGSLEGAPD